MSNSKAKETSVITSIDDPVVDTALAKAEATPELAITDNHGAFCGNKAELTINSTEGEVGKQAVFVGINGHGFNIPRDKKVIVPVEVIENLENAVMAITESGAGERDVKRFSYSVKYLPTAK